MPEMNTDRLVWVDIETFGLEIADHPILEIGFKITDIELNTIDSYQKTVWESDWYDKLYQGVGSVTRSMHNKSGLWEDARAQGMLPDEVAESACDWLDSHGVDRLDPLAGSSLQFDRAMLNYWMPAITDRFHYRNIDISTIKELCRRYNPRVFSLLETTLGPTKAHRVLPDIDDTIEEFEYYKDNFLWT